MNYLIGLIFLSLISSAQAAVSFSFNAGDYTNVRTNVMTLSWGSVRYVKMKITNNNNCSGGTWASTSKSPSVTLADTDGPQSMSVQLKTKRGDLSTCVSDAITLDRQAPIGSISVGTVQTSPTVQVDIGISASDNTNLSSISLVEASTCSSPVWGNVVATKTLSLTSNSGTKTIAFQIKDVAGNLSTCQTTSVAVEAAPTPSPTATPVPTSAPVSDGELHVDGQWIKDSTGNVVQLRGVNIPDPEHLNTKYWERPGVNAISVAQKAIEEFNVNVVRIPVLPGTSSYPNEGWFSTTNGGQKYYDNHLKPLVDYITGQKVYAIIDLHYISDYNSLYSNVAAFWTFIAPKFKDNPYVIYEMFNEPIYPDSWSTWLSTIAQPITNLIRGYAPNNLIIVGGPYWSSHMSGAATNPVVGTNIVYTAHVYSNQKSSTWETNYGPTMAKYPVFVTEWGFENGGTEGGTASGYGEPFLNWMETNRLSWTAWCFDYLWGPKMFDSNWNLTVPDGGMGTFVRDALLSNQ